MPEGYWIARVDVADQGRYKTHVAALARSSCQTLGFLPVHLDRN